MDAAHLDFADASVDLAVMVPGPASPARSAAGAFRDRPDSRGGGCAIIEVANVGHAVNRVRYWSKGQKIPTSPVDIRSERLVPERVMLAAEYAMQATLAPVSFGPSLFLLARKPA
jgi:hypothetical protein